jgi:hypothetical protein
MYRKNSPQINTTAAWFKRFIGTGCGAQGKRPGMSRCSGWCGRDSEAFVWKNAWKSDATRAAGYGQGLYFSARRCTPTLPSRSHRLSLSHGSCLDWTRGTSNVATTVARTHTSVLLPVGIREGCCLRFPLPTALHQLRARITDAIAQVDADMLRRTWEETAYRWDIYRVTRGSHIEHLWLKLDNILYQWIPLLVAFFSYYILFLSN